MKALSALHIIASGLRTALLDDHDIVMVYNHVDVVAGNSRISCCPVWEISTRSDAGGTGVWLSDDEVASAMVRHVLYRRPSLRLLPSALIPLFARTQLVWLGAEGAATFLRETLAGQADVWPGLDVPVSLDMLPSANAETPALRVLRAMIVGGVPAQIIDDDEDADGTFGAPVMDVHTPTTSEAINMGMRRTDVGQLLTILSTHRALDLVDDEDLHERARVFSAVHDCIFIGRGVRLLGYGGLSGTRGCGVDSVITHYYETQRLFRALRSRVSAEAGERVSEADLLDAIADLADALRMVVTREVLADRDLRRRADAQLAPSNGIGQGMGYDPASVAEHQAGLAGERLPRMTNRRVVNPDEDTPEGSASTSSPAEPPAQEEILNNRLRRASFMSAAIGEEYR